MEMIRSALQGVNAARIHDVLNDNDAFSKLISQRLASLPASAPRITDEGAPQLTVMGSNGLPAYDQPDLTPPNHRLPPPYSAGWNHNVRGGVENGGFAAGEEGGVVPREIRVIESRVVSTDNRVTTTTSEMGSGDLPLGADEFGEGETIVTTETSSRPPEVTTSMDKDGNVKISLKVSIGLDCV